MCARHAAARPVDRADRWCHLGEGQRALRGRPELRVLGRTGAVHLGVLVGVHANMRAHLERSANMTSCSWPECLYRIQVLLVYGIHCMMPGYTLPQINMDAHNGPSMENASLTGS